MANPFMVNSGFLRSAIVGMSMLVIFPAVAEAAKPPVLASGTRVRATVTDPAKGKTKDVTGTLVDLGDTTITMTVSNSRTPLVIPRENIAVLEASVKPSRKGSGALIGLGVGAVLGAAIGFASGDDPPGIVSFSAGAKAGMGAIVFGPLGAIIGAIGAPGEQWQAVPPDKVQLGFSRGPRGENGVCLTLRF